MTNEELDREVLFILSRHQGKENRIDRWDLVERVFGEPVEPVFQNDDNLYDRDIRYAVGRLRAAGHLICDLGDGQGAGWRRQKKSSGSFTAITSNQSSRGLMWRGR